MTKRNISRSYPEVFVAIEHVYLFRRNTRHAYFDTGYWLFTDAQNKPVKFGNSNTEIDSEILERALSSVNGVAKGFQYNPKTRTLFLVDTLSDEEICKRLGM
jgi:hypothetical protein